MVVLIVVIAMLAPLLLAPTSPPDLGARLDDAVNLRNIVVLLRTHYDAFPLTNDGALDVYRLVLDRHVEMDQALELFFGHRAGTGPSAEDIRAGNYDAFPFERCQGAPLRNQPLLWDPTQDTDSGLRMVAFANGAVRDLDPDDWAASRSP
jgi:hypothetical protein